MKLGFVYAFLHEKLEAADKAGRVDNLSLIQTGSTEYLTQTVLCPMKCMSENQDHFSFQESRTFYKPLGVSNWSNCI